METAQRVQQSAIATGQRISEGAQALASQTRQYGRDAIARAGEIRDNTVTRVTEFGQRTAARAGEIRDNTVNRATEFGRPPRPGPASPGRRRSVRPEHRGPGSPARQRCAARVGEIGTAPFSSARTPLHGPTWPRSEPARRSAEPAGQSAEQPPRALRPSPAPDARWPTPLGRPRARCPAGTRASGRTRPNVASPRCARTSSSRNDRNLVALDPGQKDLQTLTAHAHQLVAAAEQGPAAQAAAAQRLAAAATAMQSLELPVRRSSPRSSTAPASRRQPGPVRQRRPGARQPDPGPARPAGNCRAGPGAGQPRRGPAHRWPAPGPEEPRPHQVTRTTKQPRTPPATPAAFAFPADAPTARPAVAGSRRGRLG